MTMTMTQLNAEIWIRVKERVMVRVRIRVNARVEDLMGTLETVKAVLWQAYGVGNPFTCRQDAFVTVIQRKYQEVEKVGVTMLVSEHEVHKYD